MLPCFPARPIGMWPPPHHAIASVGIEHLSDRPYTKISGGERQLVLIARALAQQAPVLILDEPTSHLDFRNQVLVLETVRSIVLERGLTALMTLHDPNLALTVFRPGSCPGRWANHGKGQTETGDYGGHASGGVRHRGLGGKL